jgi:hypothetical protein
MYRLLVSVCASRFGRADERACHDTAASTRSVLDVTRTVVPTRNVVSFGKLRATTRDDEGDSKISENRADVRVRVGESEAWVPSGAPSAF